MSSVLFKLIESIVKSELEEAANYPPNFSINDFKAINSFVGRIKYAKERLPQIGSGTSRAVFEADQDTVIKIALNKKGIEQNDTETDWYIQKAFPEIIALVKDADPENTWLEMEKAQKIKSKQQFKKLAGFDLDDFRVWAINQKRERKDQPSLSLSPEIVQTIENSELIQKLIELSKSTDVTIDDFARISSWGIVNRNSQNHLVLIDYGLTDEIYKKYYNKK